MPRDSAWYENEAEKFLASHPTYFPCDHNSAALYSFLESKGLEETASNLAHAFEELFFQGKLFDGEIRNRRAKPVEEFGRLDLADIIPPRRTEPTSELDDLPDVAIEKLYRGAIQLRSQKRARHIQQIRNERERNEQF